LSAEAVALCQGGGIDEGVEVLARTTEDKLIEENEYGEGLRSPRKGNQPVAPTQMRKLAGLCLPSSDKSRTPGENNRELSTYR
jgi:hypothetical protein